MKMKRIVALGLAVVLVLGSTACSTKKEETINPEVSKQSDSDIRVGVILKTLSSEYWGYVAAGVKAAGKDLGVTVDLQGPASETAFDEQNNMIETMLASKLDAIVIAPLQPDSVISVLGDTNIPVLFVDTNANFEKKVSYIGTGNYEAAYLGGEYAAQKAGKGAKAVILAGIQGNSTSDDRERGYREAFEANGVTVESVQYAEGLADKATNIMENQLTSLKNDVDIVMCHNDETASGASKAAKQAGLNDIIIVGFDGIQAGVENVIKGDFAATVAQSPYQMGYDAVENAVKVAKGEEIEKFIDTGTKVITQENAAEYLAELKKVLGEN